MIFMENFKDINSREEVIVSDYDGVMQLIELPWLEGIKLNEDIFKDYFDMDKIKDENMVRNFINRKEYYLNNWLKKDGVELPEEVMDAFLRIYSEDIHFYKRMPFTNMAYAYARLLNSKIAKRIIFLSHCPSNMQCDLRKEERLKEFISETGIDANKVEYYSIPSNISKADWINANEPNYTLFIDDRLDIVKDVVNNTNSLNKTFLVPRFGYSDIMNDEELIEMGKVGNIITNYEVL